MLDLIPLGNQLIIKRYIVEKTRGGIIMPSKDSIPLSEGKVLICGPSAQRIKSGDFVLFGKNCGTDIDRGGDVYTVLYEKDVACKIDPSKTSEDNLIKKEI